MLSIPEDATPEEIHATLAQAIQLPPDGRTQRWVDQRYWLTDAARELLAKPEEETPC